MGDGPYKHALTIIHCGNLESSKSDKLCFHAVFAKSDRFASIWPNSFHAQGFSLKDSASYTRVWV